MINKKEKIGTTTSAVLNVIGEGTTIKGDLISDGDLRIDGKVIGSIQTKARCVVGGSATVEGNVDARNCDVSGTVTGDVKVSEVLLIKSSGVINGDLRTSKLVVENGGEFNGSCAMGSAVSMSKANEPKENFNQSATA
jgi:cytoskeletal protein CcmA (bactofilin family)